MAYLLDRKPHHSFLLVACFSNHQSCCSHPFQNPTTTVPLLFGQYAERYRERPGGFTRIHKFGHRQGDHAPHAILELCDSPRDLKFEMVARAVGRETVQRWIKTGGKPGSQYMNESSGIMDKPWIRETTKVNYGQLMKYASEERKVEFENRAIKWAVCISFLSPF